MIEIVQPAESERDPGEAAVADLEPWAGDAGLEAASLAPLAGDEAGPSASAHPRGAEQPPQPAVTAEAEEGVPFISEPERVLEEAAASAAPSASVAPGETPATNAPASANEDVLTVTEKPANPRRGWWQRLVQP